MRHAHAGSKEGWDGDDRRRPLSERGRAEALAVADALAAYAPARIVSSPYARCVDTVQPLALRLGLGVEELAALAPEGGRLAAAFLRSLAKSGRGPAVVCTHGETIEALQKRVGRPGLPFEPGSPHEKGSIWVLRARNGRFTGADYLPPGAPSTPGPPSAPGSAPLLPA